MVRTNINYLSDYAFDNNGDRHFVTLCAIVEQDNVWKDKEDIVKLEHGKPGSFMDARLQYKKKEFQRTLKLGYAICHNLDEVDEQYGEELAFKRACEKPLGIIETNYITMLQKEDIEALMQSKLDYICDNIDKFTQKRNK